MEQAIVSYLSPISVVSDQFTIERELSKVEGFSGIARVFHDDNAVIAYVDDDLIDEWVMKVRIQDNVDYCIKNYRLKLYSFQEQILGDNTNPYEANLYKLRQHHRMERAKSAKGTKVGIIDSGLASHPYTPSLTFQAVLKNKEHWHPLVKDNYLVESCLEKIVTKETNTSREDYQDFIYWTKTQLTDLKIQLWEKTRSEVKKTGYATSGDFLLDKGLLGLLGKVSLDSRNFTNEGDQFDIEDYHGHGTSMASIFSGFDSINEEVATNKLIPLTLGLATHAELVVLKVYNHEDDVRLDKLLEALTHATNVELDVLYIGLGFVEADSSYREIKPLERRLNKLKDTECIVVCPAGNLGSKGLTFPAALDSTIAVTSINFSGDTFELNQHSSYVTNSDESVAFCAFGGDDSVKEHKNVLCPSNNYGYSLHMGTSVAGAITTSIIATYISQEIMKVYTQNAHLFVNEEPLNAYISKVCDNNINAKNVLETLYKQAFREEPSSFYGYGLIRFPLDSY
ncbi:S8/S53 family peptidase [Vibrio parahaemolyticus]|nr:S8/S53 family peptidase [Vibrio parahaemolyticus]